MTDVLQRTFRAVELPLGVEGQTDVGQAKPAA